VNTKNPIALLVTAVWKRIRSPGSAGFTLVELLVVVAVLGLVLAGLFGLQQQGLNAYLGVSNRVASQQDARVAVDIMSRELRVACSITTNTATTVAFTMVDPTAAPSVNCSAPGTLLTVQYALSGATLNRTVGVTTQPLIVGVTSLTFTYFWTTAPPPHIHSVDIALATNGENPVATLPPSARPAHAIAYRCGTLPFSDDLHHRRRRIRVILVGESGRGGG
jgi:prepilin-type N-terminal cleavage/methylation domain-containing protein